MIKVIINSSKYIILFLMLLYTFWCFRINSLRDDKKTRGYFIVQKILIMTIFASNFGLILYYKFEFMTLILFMSEFLYLMVFPALFDVIYSKDSKLITNNMIFLLSLGFVMVQRLSPKNSLKQFVIVLAGSFFFFFVPKILKAKEKIKKSKWFLAIIGLVLLAITLVLGKTSFGANISFTILGFTFQPSEFVKVLFILFEASILSDGLNRKKVLCSAIMAAIFVLILVASTDLGAALIFSIVYLIMLYIASGKIRYLVVGFAGGAAASVLAYKLFYHIRVRVAAWMNPWSKIDKEGYQIAQSLFAIGTGGLFGMGLYQGSPLSIPVVNKDFVFSAISEEFGLLFAILLILVCISIFLENMKIASMCNDGFYKMIISGCGIMYIFQCFLTIGGVTKFIPSTGVTLPFVSYGGSSILSSLFMFAMIQTVIIFVKGDNNGKQKAKS